MHLDMVKYPYQEGFLVKRSGESPSKGFSLTENTMERKGENIMATSSITHDFVITDKESARRLVDALLMPKNELPKPAESVSGKEAVKLLMQKWRNAR